MLQYLARYTHRVAISNHRLLSVDDDQVCFRWKDYAHHSKHRAMALTHEEFLRRFLQHVLPRGFPRIRYFGWLANRKRSSLLPVCRELLKSQPFLHSETVEGEELFGDALVATGPCRSSSGSVLLRPGARESARSALLIAHRFRLLRLLSMPFGVPARSVFVPLDKLPSRSIQHRFTLPFGT